MPVSKAARDSKRPWGGVVREIMADLVFLDALPDGISGPEIYDELVRRGSNVAASASVLDVIDYMNEIYGPGLS
jgi:hypothetical protein